jgi:hypothetical protein
MQVCLFRCVGCLQVRVLYLLAGGTLDDRLWPMLQRKVKLEALPAGGASFVCRVWVAGCVLFAALLCAVSVVCCV